MNWCGYCNQWFWGFHYHAQQPTYYLAPVYYWPPEVSKINYLENRIMYLESRVQELERKAAKA